MTDNVLFSCSTSDRDFFHRIENNINPKEIQKCVNTEVIIDGLTYIPTILSEEIDIIVRLIQNHWCNIQTVALYDDMIPYNEIYTSRELLNGYMQLIIISLNAYDDTEQKIRYLDDMFDALQNIPNFIVPFEELDQDILLKIAAVNVNNKKCPIYQYLHTNLDIHYNVLFMYYFCEKTSVLVDHIERILQNLIIMCKLHFKRLCNDVFVCPCMKQFFMLLQFITHKIDQYGNTFWKIFNKLLHNDDPLFSIALLKELAEIECIVKCKYISTDVLPNFEFLDSKLKLFLANAQSNIIPEVFKLINKLVNDIWSKYAKIEVFQLIWDYYSKRLNISNKNYMKLSSMDIYKNVETIFSMKDNCKEDFELFVAMLLAHLKIHPEHWGRMKGRIYSQLGTNKVKELNETGIAHVGILFITLSTLFHEEMEKKIISFFDVFIREKKELPIIWNLYMAFVFQNVKDSRDLEKTAIGIKQMLENTCSESRSFYFIRIFLADFVYCVSLTQNMTLHQWSFFDTWIDKYLSTCSFQDLRAAIEIFLIILDKLRKTDSWLYWKDVFREYIYPVLKKLSISLNAPEEIGKIGGLISIMDLELSETIFNTFTLDVSPKVSNQFLLMVLNDYRDKYVLSEHQKSVFVQSWIKICLLTEGSNEELTSKFLNLEIFPLTLKTYIGNSQNPLYAMLEYLGSDIKNHLQSNDIYKLCENSFGHIDKWLVQYLNHIDNEIIVNRIFTFISLAFLHCGRLLYNRNKISTPLTKLVEVLLLPQEVLLGKSPQTVILNAVKQTWNVFFEALVNLNTDCDKYLARTLRDMITKYVPFFTPTDSPFVKCFNNEQSARVFLKIIGNSYFTHPVKESDTNILKILNILRDIIESTSSLSLLKIIIDMILYNIFEFIILHPQRNGAFVVVRAITNSPLYSQISKEFCNTVLAISEKHLAHNTINHFQLLCILAKFVPCDMKKLLDTIKQHVSNVEKLRGVGFDKNLRMQFEKFENAINENM